MIPYTLYQIQYDSIRLVVRYAMQLILLIRGAFLQLLVEMFAIFYVKIANGLKHYLNHKNLEDIYIFLEISKVQKRNDNISPLLN